MLSRNNSFEISSVFENADQIDSEIGSTTDNMDLPEIDIGDLFDKGLNSPRQLSTVMNMDEQEFLNSCDNPVPDDFDASIFSDKSDKEPEAEESEAEESEEEESEEEESEEEESEEEESEDESTHVDAITVQKLEALVEEYKQKDATNKRKLEEMQERIDEMEGEIDQHMEDKQELQSKLDEGEATDDEGDTGVSARRCHECKAAETNCVGHFNQVHFYYKDEICAQHEIEYYCKDCKSESFLRARALEYANEVHADCHGEFSTEFSRKKAVIIVGDKVITFGELKNRPMKRRRVSPKSSNIVPLLTGSKEELDLKRTVKCPWGCGFEVRLPKAGDYDDLRPLKYHIANPQNDCIHPRMKTNLPTRVATNPYPSNPNKHCPVATPGIDALIMHGFKKLKTNPSFDWVNDFMKWQCQICDFKHYHKGRYQEHMKTHGCMPSQKV